MENLLTKIEINKILQEAKLNPALRVPNVISLDTYRTSVIKISPNNGLILIEGDSSTGFTHIRERHNYWSEKVFWKDGYENKLDTPSQFGKDSMPIIDYIDIIDQVYSKKNLNKEKNKKPKLFEMYSGLATSRNLEEAKYHLILYKNTKIVHTLYPHSQKKNKKKIIDLVRGKPKGILKLNPIYSTIAIPYSNKEGNVAYSFQVIFNYEQKIENGIIIKHLTNETFNIFEKRIDKIIELNQLIEEFEYLDLTPIEKIIREIEKKTTTNNA